MIKQSVIGMGTAAGLFAASLAWAQNPNGSSGVPSQFPAERAASAAEAASAASGPWQRGKRTRGSDRPVNGNDTTDGIDDRSRTGSMGNRNGSGTSGTGGSGTSGTGTGTGSGSTGTGTGAGAGGTGIGGTGPAR